VQTKLSTAYLVSCQQHLLDLQLVRMVSSTVAHLLSS
jgi:hypothetical protein